MRGSGPVEATETLHDVEIYRHRMNSLQENYNQTKRIIQEASIYKDSIIGVLMCLIQTSRKLPINNVKLAQHLTLSLIFKYRAIFTQKQIISRDSV